MHSDRTSPPLDFSAGRKDRRSRQRFLGVTGLLVAILSLASGAGQAQNVVDGFDPEFNGLVRVVEQLRSGHLLVGGNFTQIDGITRSYLTRIDNTGTVDSGFNVAISGSGIQTRVLALRHQASGHLLVGGRFTTVAGQPRTNLARLTSAGALDAGFNVPVDGDVGAFWDAPGIPGGLLYIGGSFDTVHGQPRHGVARLNADGTLSPGFAPPQMNGSIWTMQPHSRPGMVDGLLVAGAIGEVDGQPIDAPIVRLNRFDGSVDPEFYVSTSSEIFFGNSISEIAVQPDGRILIAGHFDTVHGQPRENLARLHPDGSLDESFVPPVFDGTLSRVRLQGDGRIVVAGNFTNSPLRRNVARLHADGSWDTSFNGVLVAERVDALAIQADGKVVAGGTISQIGVYPRQNLVRMYSNGAPEVDFQSSVLHSVYAMAIQSDGNLLVGGIGADGKLLRRLSRNGLASGSFDPPLASGPAFVYGLAVQPDGRILVGGTFPARLRRLHPNGDIDSSFNVSVNSNVFAVIHEPDGSVIFSGPFSQVNGQPRDGLARVDGNGVLDPAFSPTTNGFVTQLVRQADGKLLIAGSFDVVNSAPRTHLARLNADGSLDLDFEVDTDDRIWSMAVQNDGRIIIGGSFDEVDGQQRRGIARLLANGTHDAAFNAPTNYVPSTSVQSIQLMPNGQILFVGTYTQSGTGNVGFLRRLSANGDPFSTHSFAETGEAVVSALAIDIDGHAYVAGHGLAEGGEPFRSVDRVPNASFAMESTFVLAKDNLYWQHRGSGAALTRQPQLQVAAACCNEADFVPVDGAYMSLQQGTVDQWRLSGLDIPGSGTVWVRARGFASSAAGGLYPIDSPILAIDLGEDDDVLFANGFE